MFITDGSAGQRQLIYRIADGDSRAAFYVDTSGSDGAVLRTTVELDREVCDIYHVLVEAVDLSQHTAATEVVVMVTDVNDNAPSFPEFTAITVREGKVSAVSV